MGLLDFLTGGGDDAGFRDARNAVNQNRGLYDSIMLPEYDTYSPELYKTDSADYSLMTEDPTIKSMQLSALNKMAGLADTGLSSVDDAGFMLARDEGNQMARAGTQAAIENAQARGVGGSGLEFAMREIANQQGAQRAQDAGLNQAAESARQRAMYNQAYGQQLAGVRSQDAQTAKGNTDIINQFNQMNTQNRNRTNAANVDAKNDAFKYNEGLKDKTYNNQMKRADSMAGLNNRNAEIGMAESAQEQQRKRAMGGLVGAGLGYAASGSPAGASVGYGIGSSL
jgi:hypothetical protein